MFVSLHRQAFRNNVLVSKVQRALLSAVTKNKQKIIARYGQMWEILSQRTGAIVNVIEVPEGALLPPDMVILHEHTDHYSLQTTKSIKPSVFSKNVTEFLNKFEVYPKKVYFERYPFPNQ